MEGKIWYQSPEELINPNKLTSFIPSVNDDIADQMNSLVRFSIYFTLITVLFNFASGKFNVAILYFPLFVMVFTYFMYQYHPNFENFQNNDSFLETQPIEKIAKKRVVPVKDNPFMNPLVTDFGKKDRKPIAPTEIKPVKKEIEKQFNHNLYHDVEDVFSRNHSQRQFYTTPSTTIPNDQENFAKWLYGQDKTCKESKQSCQEKW